MKLFSLLPKLLIHLACNSPGGLAGMDLPGILDRHPPDATGDPALRCTSTLLALSHRPAASRDPIAVASLRCDRLQCAP